MATDEKLLKYLKRVTTELHNLRKQGSRHADEPIAIVGMACRLPGGVTSPEDLWRLVADGVDAVSDFPSDRGWDLEGLFDNDPDRPGTSYVRKGGFLQGAGLFDAGFFGISPREALVMDPQQRLLLETSWEALEGAGVDPTSLKGTDVGVFSGVFAQGYGAGPGTVPPELEGYVGTGGASSVASGRVSYVLGFEGPAVTIDTACSSSLVAIHLAAQSLRLGECSMALAGGATVMANPGAFVEFSRQRGLAVDGRCKAFAAAADGTGWAEGAGVVVLERLSVARERGHRILAVMRGSAVNQDGASNGLTAPNGPSQQRVIRRALAGAGLVPSDVDVVEAHGTGTSLGDPIEAQALLATYGQGRDPENPLWLGSLKSNVGHAQGAAGVAGVIKMVQALRHSVMPSTLHVDAPTPEVDWSAGAVSLLTEAREWPRNGHPRRAGVSAFGMSGTNAHVILEEAPDEPAADEALVSPGVVPLAVSAKSVGSLAGQAERLATFMAAAQARLPDVAAALVSGRAALDERAVVVAGSREEAAAGLEALARGETSAGVVTGRAGAVGKVVWVFPGQGSQWVGMGRELLDSSPVFAERISECAAALEPWVDWSLVDVLRGDTDLLARVDVVQPASFAVMVGLAAVWSSVGLVPDAVMGHSQGEIAAACVAGALSLEDAARVVALRSQAIASALSGRGGMASVASGEDAVIARLAPWADRVEVAAVNGPSSVVIAGDAQALDEALEALSDNGVRVRRVAVDYASHTRHVEDIQETLAESLAEVSAQAPTVPFYSTVIGDWIRDAGVVDGGYWYRNLRSQVRFGPAVTELLDQGHEVFVEISAHPVLVQPITEIGDVTVVGSLRRDDGRPRRLLTSMAELFVRGVALDWTGALPAGAGRSHVDLPTYAFDHRQYWLQAAESATDAASLGQAAADHPLLGAVVALPQSDGLVFTSRLSLRSHPWLADHAVGGVVIVPGTGLVELAVRAGDEAGCSVLDELVIEAPLVLPANGGVRVQVALSGPGEDGSRTVEVYSLRDGDTGGWTRNATGTLSSAQVPASGFDFAAWPPPDAERVEAGDFYTDLVERGYTYGPAFQGLRAVWRRGDEVFAEVALPEEQRAEAGRFGVHPALLDAAQHAGVFGAATGEEPEQPMLPFAWNGLVLHAAGASALRVRLTSGGPNAVSLQAADETGGLVVTVDSLVARPVSTEQLGAVTATRDALFALEWVELPPTQGVPSPSWVSVATAEDVAGLVDVPAVLEVARGDALDVTSRVLAVVQAWLAGDRDSRLVVVTRGAVPAGDGGVSDPAAAAVWGLVRAAQTENPDRVVLLDLDTDGDVEAVLGTVLACGEPQVAVRGSALSVPRLMPAADGVLRMPADAPEWRLINTGDGTLDSLALVPEPGAPLAPGQVRVGLRALGVNFRDVLIALGMYPGAANVGGEGAGVVLEVGEGVTGLAVGDRVMGLTGDRFGSVTETDHRYLVRMPAGWSFEQAASVPVVFLTAYYALRDLAGLRAGESVLLHAAAGGVGMAATQVARHLGATVFGTASPGKWAVLREQGIEDAHIASSRTAEFEERFLTATSGAGVDVVLDSLAGELVDASLRLLPRGGRFIEMGKTDIRDADAVAAAHPGVHYRAFDLTEAAGPERIQQMLTELVALFDAGILTPLPRRTWDVRCAPDAFRFMSQAKHIGKIVLTVPRSFGPHGTVLVSGGGVLGGVVARHLVSRHGVRRLVLASRRGRDADGADDLVAELAWQGAEVSVVACDLADRAQVATLLAAHPVSAVVHTAGVLDDGVIGALTPERLAKVFAPKVDAVRHLDELTRGLELDAFIVFSAAAGVFGGAGQGNYAAANTFLDGLMAQRRSAGLPGLSLAWGMWEQATGMTAHLGQVEQARASRGGSLAMTAAEGMELFDAAMASGQAVLVPVKLDLRRVRAGGGVPHLLRGLVRAGRQLANTATTDDESQLSNRLAGLAAAEQEALLLDLVRTQAAVVLGHAGPGAVGAELAFKDAGFDSLTSVELRNRLRTGTGLKLPATLVFDYPTPQALARYLRDELGDTAATPTATTVVTAEPDEPIAIVGMACRLPGGVSSPEDLWRLVADGVEAVGDFPDDRGWDLEGLYDPDPDQPGTSYVRKGGFLRDAGDFDAAFFGISPREALVMDPQQRLLLEASWEALEGAGVDPVSLKGTDVGVFSGVFTQGYGGGSGVVPPELEGYKGTGGASSVASGRVSYVFGLEGPAMTVDTACSSSLVAMHLAAQALRSGECSMALAGGATVMATPGAFVEFSRQRGMAADGRCKAFGDGADGMVLSEGVGVVVLERLSVARERGHRVLAVIRGSAVNQDGASNGLTAPNGPSQQRVIRRALASAGLSPSDVDAVEGHGTGTALGDPIEAQALLATYGRDRSADRPLWLGSIKSNVGHAQAAAGVAGVIKMVQALRHGVLPPTLHAQEPTSQVDWSVGAVSLLTEAREWPRNGQPRRAGVSSFGVSGTNAHLIIEEAPEEPAAEESVPAGVVPLVVSARSAGSLAGQAGRLAAFLEDEVSLADVAGALVSGRGVFGERAVVVAESRQEALAGLVALARGETAAGVVTGRAGTPGKLVWVFPGQGSQWVGMGRELLDSSSVFAERISECAAALEPWVDWSLVDVLRGDVDLLARVDVVQPASFAVMVGLAAVWSSVGVVPDAVLGHSQGEIAAACVAGALSLEDAARVVALRSKAIATTLSGRGGMASVALGEVDVVARLAPWADRVEVAAVNSPSSVVVAGDAQALDEALEALSDSGVRVRRVAVDYASHTRHVEDIQETLAEALAGITAQAPVVPFFSTVTGEWVQGAGVVDGGYWYRNLRSQVGFGPAVADLLGQGHGVFVEVSAHPVLVQPISEIVDDGVVVGSLRRDEGGLQRLLTSMGELFVRGVAVDWSGVLPTPTRRVDLPTYAFDRQHYWLDATESTTDVASLGLAGAGHPLLGAVVHLPQTDGMVFTSRLSLRSHPWLADHALGGVVVVPGTGLVELAVRAGDEAGCSVLDELVIETPLVLPEDNGIRVQVALSGPGEDGSRTVQMYSQRGGDTEAWTRNATGRLSAPPPVRGTGFAELAERTSDTVDFTAWPPPGVEHVDIEDVYGELAERGYAFGPAFQGLRAMWRRGDEIFAEVALPEELHKDASGFGIHPALLDAALHPAWLNAGDGDDQKLRLPLDWNGLVLHAAGATALRVRLTSGPGVTLEAADEAGGLVVTVDSAVARPVSTEQLDAAATTRDALFGVEWVDLPPAQGPSPSWVPVTSAEEVAGLADDVLSGAEEPAVAVMDVAGGDALALSCQVLEVVQCWLAGGGLDESRLVVVTHGAVPAGDGAVTDPAAAAVWGLVRAAQAENPDRIVLLDLDPAADDGPDAVLGAVLATGEPQVAVRGTVLSVPRLVRATGQVANGSAAFGPEGTVLVSGAGVLGGVVARHLVAGHGVRRLVLASRRGRDAEGVEDLVAELTGQGADVSVVACDFSDRDQVAAVLASIPDSDPLSGVVHTAGVLDDGVIGALTPERLAGVFASKVDAVRHLDELTRGLDLDAFVVFSSAAGVFGGAGQGNYAAANAFLDGLMAHRRAAGLPGLSLAWGLWEQATGLTAHLGETRAGRGGSPAMTAAEGMELFDAAVRSGQALLVPTKLDLRQVRAGAAVGGVPHLLRGLVRASRQLAHVRGSGEEGRQLSDRLAGLAAAEQETLLLDLVRAQVAAVLGHRTTHHVDADQGLFEIGFDSLTAIELRNRLRGITEKKLAPNLVFAYPTPRMLAAHLHEVMCGEQAAATVAISA